MRGKRKESATSTTKTQSLDPHSGVVWERERLVSKGGSSLRKWPYRDEGEKPRVGDCVRDIHHGPES